MKNNKLFALVLALLVCLSLVVSASAASSNDLVLALEPSGSSVEGIGAIVHPEETFTVKVNVDTNPGYMFNRFALNFDSEVLELVSTKALVDSCFISVSDTVVTVSLGDIYGWMKDAAAVNTKTGAVAELTFKVVSTEDVKTNVSMTYNQKNTIGSDGLNGNLTIKCDDLVISAVGVNHKCDAEKTIEANNYLAPTCSTVGREADRLCNVCGEVVVEGKEIPTTSHSFDEGVVSLEPTCTDEGEKTLTCTVCGATAIADEKIPAKGHTEGEAEKEKEVAPTCTAKGSYDEVVYCSVCGVELSRTTVPTDAKGHSFDDGKPAPDATCTTVGKIVFTCTVCGETKDGDQIPAKDHDWGEKFISKQPSCTAEGQYSRTCKRCNETVDDEKIAATGHDWDNGVITKNPGCDTMGEQTFTCKVCREKQVDTNVPATGHSFGDFVETKAPTTEEEGEKTSTCANCGETKTESIAKLPEPVKSNTALIVGIIIAVVLVGAGCAVFFVLKNKKKK